MQSNRIITIGRQFGSGGKAIGQIVADKLGIKLYDKELLALASKESGISEDVIANSDELLTNDYFYMVAMDPIMSSFDAASRMPIGQQAFLAQFDAIQKLAESESCVIVGRCADYALRDFPNVTSVFINGETEDKVALISQLHNISNDKALDLITKTDKKRAEYYNYYSDMEWGVASTYDMCVNSSRISYEGAANAIIEFVKIKEKSLEN